MPFPAPAALAVGLETLRGNPLRTLLSTLGVIMGVASLVAVLAVGDGVEQFAREQVERTTDLQTIVVAPNTRDEIDGVIVPRTVWPNFTMATRDSLAQLLGANAEVGILITGSGRIGVAGKPRAATVVGADASAISRMPASWLAGGRFTDDAVRRADAVATISLGLARLVTDDSLGAPAAVAQAAMGRTVTLGTVDFRIIGVAAGERGRERTLAAVVPFPTAAAAMVAVAEPRAAQLRIRAKDVVQVDTLAARLRRWAAAMPASSGTAEVLASTGLRLDQVRQGVIIFKVLMGAFAGIALLVGGIGIMNVLIAAVTERTREIGIRKASGARQRDILGQFLTESVVICAAGAALGAALGLSGAFGVTWLMRRMAQVELFAAFTWGRSRWRRRRACWWD